MFVKIIYGGDVGSTPVREEIHETNRVEWWEDHDENDVLYIETDDCLLEVGMKGRAQVYVLNNSGKTIEKLL